mmetsp:Transcript_88824/g.153856  ORF Transcript_88824/g.153856 Transcript_88824/m.153856 type:complete len:214 (-) Transcript_88824:114-755(-)
MPYEGIFKDHFKLKGDPIDESYKERFFDTTPLCDANPSNPIPGEALQWSFVSDIDWRRVGFKTREGIKGDQDYKSVLQADEGLSEFAADLKDPACSMKEFKLVPELLYKDDVYSKVRFVRVVYTPTEGAEEKQVVCKVGPKHFVETIKLCGYSCTAVGEGMQTLLAYGSWEPIALTGSYKIEKREDFGKYDEMQAYREWQKAQRKKLEASWSK